MMVTTNPTPLRDLSALGFRRRELVVVTGAGSGIGEATALMAGASGLAVAAWDVDAAAAERTAASIRHSGGMAIAAAVDVGEDRAVVAAWDTSQVLGPCRYLVNNAGPSVKTIGAFEQLLSLAVGSVERVTRTWLERHADAAAAVVNLASTAGNFHGAGTSPASQAFYPAAKAAIAGYTRFLATRYRGIPRANAVAPGFTLTPRTAASVDAPNIRDAMTRIPIGRPGTAEEIAAAILFLLSPAASYVNGVLLPVDGGWITA
ncbi:SDR family NAD(P)-dependent oxidoreductase [uncultured Sphingomonas sp.]|uniref:SDR family NAD(P)-dependent oxidoreductase n=1 Tax=uncultured Sphingomonas sp. TaxID=158754 RepID=UPI0035CBABEA